MVFFPVQNDLNLGNSQFSTFNGMAANFENKYQGDKNAFSKCVRCSSGLFGSVNNNTIPGMFITYSAQERCWNLASGTVAGENG